MNSVYNARVVIYNYALHRRREKTWVLQEKEMYLNFL